MVGKKAIKNALSPMSARFCLPVMCGLKTISAAKISPGRCLLWGCPPAGFGLLSKAFVKGSCAAFVQSLFELVSVIFQAPLKMLLFSMTACHDIVICFIVQQTAAVAPG